MSKSLMESLAGLVREWKQASVLRPGGASVLDDERRAGAAEAYRECAQQLSMALASHPTEAPESGVVVVPADLVRRLVRLCWAHEMVCERHRRRAYDKRLDLSERRWDRERLQAKADAEVLEAALSRLQQNEQPTESRITVTIDVQTWQGHHDIRVITVDPGIGWPERLVPQVEWAAKEMEEQHLGLQQNGGADHD